MKESSETFKIDSTADTFFHEYLTLKKPILEEMLSRLHNRKVTLNPKLLSVFAYLLYYNHKYKNMEDSIKWELIFNNSTKEEIMNKLNISKMHLNTYFSTLRSLKLLNGNKINDIFVVYPNGGYDLTFKFTFHEE